MGLKSKVAVPRVKVIDKTSKVIGLGPITYNRETAKELLGEAIIS